MKVISADELVDEVLAYSDADLALMTLVERAEYDREVDRAAAAWALEHEDDWDDWLTLLFADYFRAPFAAHHADLWSWVWSIELGVRPAEVFVAVWPRGGAKSTSAEAAVAALGARKRRRFALYVCDTQQQADDHVQNIAGLLETPIIDMAYPELGARAVGKYGTAKGWRRNRLRTASGLVIDALGLDTAARGIKVNEFRPDLIVFDDIDNEKDGPGQVEKKISDMTNKLLPAGDASLAVLVIQNVPNPQGIVARLAGIAEEPAEFLRPRHVSGPIPALEEFTYEQREDGTFEIVYGVATWAGQPIERCQQQVNEWGITAFRTEAQHETDARGGKMFDHLAFAHCRREDVPPLVHVEVWVDPAVTDTDSSDAHAVQCDGLAADGTIYRLRSWERRASTVDSLRLAIVWAMLDGAVRVGVETDQGGDTWRSVYKEAFAAVNDDLASLGRGDVVDGPAEYVPALVELAGRDTLDWIAPFYDEDKASRTQQSKASRAQKMLVDYERPGRIVHVLGTHLLLEAGLRRFPRRKPFDLVDAAYWSWRALRKRGQGAQSSARSMAHRRLPAVALIGGSR